MVAAGLKPEGVVTWGRLINTDEPGIYVVTSLVDVGVEGVNRRSMDVDPETIDTLLELRPELTIDGLPATAAELIARLNEFWLADEHILYIGLAVDLHDRVNQYYGTPLGARRPHAGGWFLKTLSGLDQMHVHWARTYDRVNAEAAALGAFVSNVSTESLAQLRDPDRPFPFANLEWPAGIRKRHGIRGAKAPRVRLAGTESGRRAEESEATPPARAVSRAPAGVSGKSTRTQRVTNADLAGGRIRIPRASKQLFPSDRARLDLVLRGVSVQASWDPRMGPPERSGVLSVGRERLAQTVRADEVLNVSVVGSSYSLT